MDHYKQINKQLIDSNRELKQLVTTYQKDICQLRADLMEEHRLRVEFERSLRERLVLLVAHNFRSVLEEINPNIGILEALGLCGVGKRDSNEGVAYSTGNVVEYYRRSTELVEEFRRSSALHQRQRVVQMSPARRSQSKTIESDHEEKSLSIEEEITNSSEEADGEGAAVIEVECETSSPAGLQLISEDNEDGAEENLLSATMRSLQVSQEDDCTPEEETVPDRQSSLRDSNHQVNGYSASLNVVVKRGRALSQHNWLNDSDNSIEGIRCVANDQPITPHRYAYSLDSNETEGTEKIVNRSPSLQISKISMENFNGAACSTPCDMAVELPDITLRPSEPSQSKRDHTVGFGSFMDTTAETSRSSRPSRKCAPKSLVEPKIITKLRNNNATKTKKIRKKK